MRQALIQEAPGILFIFLGGSLLHFTYAWSGHSWIVGIFSAVNESVWEHLKMTFWPVLVFALVERPFVGGQASNYWLAKSAGLLVTLLGIVGGYYGYVALVGHYGLAAGIMTFALSVVVGQALSARLLLARDLGSWTRRAAIAGLVLATVAFSVFSYRPPRLALFEHQGSGQYGILDEGEAH